MNQVGGRAGLRRADMARGGSWEEKTVALLSSLRLPVCACGLAFFFALLCPLLAPPILPPATTYCLTSHCAYSLLLSSLPCLLYPPVPSIALFHSMLPYLSLKPFRLPFLVVLILSCACLVALQRVCPITPQICALVCLTMLLPSALWLPCHLQHSSTSENRKGSMAWRLVAAEENSSMAAADAVMTPSPLEGRRRREDGVC